MDDHEAAFPVFERITIDRAVVVRAAAALAAYLGAMRAELGDDRETVMARIRGADKMAHPAYAELYAALHPASGVAASDHQGIEGKTPMAETLLTPKEPK